MTQVPIAGGDIAAEAPAQGSSEPMSIIMATS